MEAAERGPPKSHKGLFSVTATVRGATDFCRVPLSMTRCASRSWWGPMPVRVCHAGCPGSSKICHHMNRASDPSGQRQGRSKKTPIVSALTPALSASAGTSSRAPVSSGACSRSTRNGRAK